MQAWSAFARSTPKLVLVCHGLTSGRRRSCSGRRFAKRSTIAAVASSGLLSMTRISRPSVDSAATDSSVASIHSAPAWTGMTTDRNGLSAIRGSEAVMLAEIVEQQLQDEAGHDHQHSGDDGGGDREGEVDREIHRSADEDPLEREQRVRGEAGEGQEPAGSDQPFERAPALQPGDNAAGLGRVVDGDGDLRERA